MSEQFTCSACRRTFDKEWTDEEAMNEATTLFPDVHDLVVVCDDCWWEMGLPRT